MASEPVAKKPRNSSEFLSGLTIYLHPAALSKTRKSIFERQVAAKGGRLVTELSKEDSQEVLVLIDDGLIEKTRVGLLVDKMLVHSSARCVALSWLSDCLREEKLLDRDGCYLLSPSSTPSPSTSKAQEPGPSSLVLQDKFVCSQSSQEGALVNHNKTITDELEKLAKAYKNSNDTWWAVLLPEPYQKDVF